jgi:hypothetical protein
MSFYPVAVVLQQDTTHNTTRSNKNITQHYKYENANVRNIGQGETPHRKHKGIKLGCGNLQDRSVV